MWLRNQDKIVLSTYTEKNLKFKQHLQYKEQLYCLMPSAYGCHRGLQKIHHWTEVLSEMQTARTQPRLAWLKCFSIFFPFCFRLYRYQCGLWGCRRANERLRNPEKKLNKTKKKQHRQVRRRKGGLLATCGLRNPGTNHRGTWQLEWQMNNGPLFQPPVNRPIHHSGGD